MSYSVKEMYLTVQGEGAQTGIPAVFLRFAGCNLWSGLEKDRSSAVCKFCDTDFVGTNGAGGGKFITATALAQAVSDHWPVGAEKGEKWVVCTGGEPLLQLDSPLITTLHDVGFKIAVETNGTLKAPKGLDWICVSPKADAPLLQSSGHELKLVYPQTENSPEAFTNLDFEVFSLQPLDDKNKAANEKAAFDYCLKNPLWRLSTQTHKYIGVP